MKRGELHAPVVIIQSDYSLPELDDVNIRNNRKKIGSNRKNRNICKEKNKETDTLQKSNGIGITERQTNTETKT